jgi:ferredoxin
VTRVYVDQLDCTGSGQCELMLAELFVVTDDGLATVLDAAGVPAPEGGEHAPVEVPAEHLERVRDVVAVCPGACVHLVDER